MGHGTDHAMPLLLSDLCFDFVAVLAVVGPSVDDIFGEEAGIRAQDVGIAGRQVSCLDEEPKWIWGGSSPSLLKKKK